MKVTDKRRAQLVGCEFTGATASEVEYLSEFYGKKVLELEAEGIPTAEKLRYGHFMSCIAHLSQMAQTYQKEKERIAAVAIIKAEREAKKGQSFTELAGKKPAKLA